MEEQNIHSAHEQDKTGSPPDSSLPVDSYKYLPWRHPVEIRVLSLLPGNDDKPLSGTLMRTSLEAHSSYTALSYCWGDATRSEQILCNNQRLKITKNLYSALQRLRQIGVVSIWADAVAINQDDNRERELQVRLMSRTFSQAKEVICDLGEAEDDFEPAIQLVKEINTVIRDFKGDVSIHSEEFQHYRLPPPESRLWEAWRKFLSRPWFRRMWIKQEFAVAKNVQMLCGTSLFDWEMLSSVLEGMRKYDFAEGIRVTRGPYDWIAVFASQEILAMTALRQSLQRGERWSLLDAPAIGRHAKASDPRDKLYARLGLTSDADDPAFYVSYTDSTETVYQRATRRMVEKYGNSHGIAILYEAVGLNDRLPSWTIDWDQPLRANKLGGRQLYNCAASTTSNIRLDPNDISQLVVRGWKFDEVLKTSWMWEGVDHGSEVAQAKRWDYARLWESNARALLDGISTYPTGETIIQAYSTTLTADSNISRKLAPVAVIESYVAFQQMPDTTTKTQTDSLENNGPYWSPMNFGLGFRRFCVTAKGYFGLVPPEARPGDLICILLGGDAPVILRRDRSYDRYFYVGDCYITGLMDGEALANDDVRFGDLVLR